MYIDIVPNRASAPAILLRESYRDGDKVKKRTIGNISSLSMDKVELIRQVLRGDSLVPVTDLFENTSSVHHGHVKAVQVAMKHLGMDKLIGSRPSRERDLALADDDKEVKKTRDPVAAAKRSAQALKKVATKKLEDGTEVHSFQTLLKGLSTIVRNVCRYKNPGDNSPAFTMDTIPSKEQQRAFDLLATIRM